MGEFGFFRVLQLVAGLICIAAFLRGIIWKDSEIARMHWVNRWLMLYGGIGLFLLGMFGKLPLDFWR